MTLFELAEECRILRDLYQSDKEITAEMVELAELDLKEKIRNYCIIIKEIKAERAAVKDQREKLAARERSLTNNLEFLLKTLHNVQLELDLKKVTVDGHRSTITKKADGVRVVDEEAIDDEFKRVDVTVKIQKNEAMRVFRETQKMPEGFELKDEETYVRVS